MGLTPALFDGRFVDLEKTMIFQEETFLLPGYDVTITPVKMDSAKADTAYTFTARMKSRLDVRARHPVQQPAVTNFKVSLVFFRDPATSATRSGTYEVRIDGQNVSLVLKILELQRHAAVGLVLRTPRNADRQPL